MCVLRVGTRRNAGCIVAEAAAAPAPAMVANTNVFIVHPVLRVLVTYAATRERTASPKTVNDHHHHRQHSTTTTTANAPSSKGS